MGGVPVYLALFEASKKTYMFITFSTQDFHERLIKLKSKELRQKKDEQ